MGVIDLSNPTTWPIVYSFTGALTWQEFTLPFNAGKVTLINEHTADPAYLAVANMGKPGAYETPADGVAVGTHRVRAPAGTWGEITMRGVADPGASRTAFAAGDGLPLTIVVEPRP